jgi:hypothetical protein
MNKVQFIYYLIKKYDRHALIVLIMIGLWIGSSTLLCAQSIYSYPLKLSQDSRFLTDQNNKLFFWSGEAAWSLIAQLDRADINYYLDDRQQKGFTVLMVNLIEHRFCTNAPDNIYNEPPFLNQSFTTPNEPYFAHADYAIRAAAQRGIAILLCPLYLGYECGDQGWCAEVQKAALADLYIWGRYIGRRYQNNDNLIWCIGGDTDPSPVKERVLACINGILESDSRHLITAHNQPESFALSPWEGEPWLAINNVYSYSKTLYEQCGSAYSRVPAMPYFMMESAYENEHKTSPQRLRSEAYWPLLSGAIGHIFGNCPIWHFDSDSGWCGLTGWKKHLNQAGSVSIDYVQKLFRSRPWHLLIPDFNHQVLSAGYGVWGSEKYATAAITSDSTTVIVYLPERRQVTINMAKISGPQAKCWWFNPATGKVTEIGIFPANGSREYMPPVEGDWVLVIDNATKNFPPPGREQIY